MSLVLLNLQSKQQIKLENNDPLIIGRGNVEGCFDKRVSRSHGRITLTEDGKIHLVALHTNPCFITRNGVPPVLQLKKNEEETLSKGDCLGLLPDAFWFQIISGNDFELRKKLIESKTIKVEQDVEEIETYAISNDLDLKPIKEEGLCFTENHKNNENVDSLELTAQPSTSQVEPGVSSIRPELEKTRRLPLWMYEIDEPKNSHKNSNKRSSAKADGLNTKKSKISSDDEVTDTYTIKEEANELSNSPSSSINNRLPNASSKGKCQTQADVLTNKQEKKKDGYESDLDESVKDNTTRRPYCQYEANCYRKNPLHRVGFCHPGDNDYLPYEQRPPCQYGAYCYRRNPIHKIEFKHPFSGSKVQNTSPASSCSCGSGEERPPCEYGSSCWRHDPTHRKAFYHPPKGYICHFSRYDDDWLSDLGWDTVYSSDSDLHDWENTLGCDFNDRFYGPYASSLLPLKRSRKKVKRQNSEYEDEDEYDLDDPFIDDASSDEYMPSESISEVEDLDSFQDDN